MKQGVKIHMPVLFKNIDLDDVRQIEFIFKKNRSHGAPSFKNELWTSDGSAGNCTRRPSSNVILVPWERAETYVVCGDFYMDTLISMTASTDNPITNIVKLSMSDTLFDPDGSDGA